MYLPYQAVHSPLMAPAYYTDQYKDIKNKNRRVYAGMVTAMDEGIGNITQTLKNVGMWDDTVIFFSTGKCMQFISLFQLKFYSPIDIKEINHRMC